MRFGPGRPPRRAKLLLLLLAAIGLSSGFAAPPAFAQKTIHVPADQKTIQAGIGAASSGDTVLVAPGTYKENIDFQGKAITVTSSAGPATTILQGDGTSAVVVFHSNEVRNSVISGFTIRGGGAVYDPTSYTGGVEASGASPSILDNIITANGCNAITVQFGGALIQGNTISGTTFLQDAYCTFDGSAVVLQGNSESSYQFSEVIGNTIANNQQAYQYDGGGMLIWAAEGSVVEQNVFANNGTTGQGGAITAYNTVAMTIAGNLFYGNAAAYGGGAISILAPESGQGPFVGLIQNNTFVQNTLTDPNQQGANFGSASQVRLEGNLGIYEFTDNVVYGQDSFPAILCGETYNYLSITPLVIDHNDIFNAKGPAYGGACPDQTGVYGNISSDPQFKNAAAQDFHLLKGSPAIDTGNNSALQLLENAGIGLTTDLDGNARIQDATGKGYPVVDMGAYEFPGVKDDGATTIVLTPSAYDLEGGARLTLTAQLAYPNAIPDGSVTFFEDGKQIGSSPIDNTGVATWTVAALAPGVHAFLATYAGHGSFPPSESVKIYVLVNTYGVNLVLTSSPNPSLLGQPVQFTANISAADGVPSGAITVTFNSTTLATLTPDKNGNASFTTSSLPLGGDFVTASYPGNATHQSAQASDFQTVTKGFSTATTIASSPNPSQNGQSVAFTATVNSAGGAVTGSVAFADGATALATVPLQNGAATYTTSSLSVGSHAITATYAANGSFLGSSASLNQVVNGLSDTTALAATPNPAYAQAPVLLSAKVTAASGTPTGSIAFLDGTTPLGSATVAANGTATLSTSFSAAGTHSLTAVYSGDKSYSPSTSPAFSETILLNSTSTTVSAAPNPGQDYATIALTAKVSSPTASHAGGSVSFFAGSTLRGSVPLQNGVATLPVAFAAGTYAITAVYSGNSAFRASTSAADSLVVLPAPSKTLLTSSLNPSPFGTSVTFTAALSAAAPPSAFSGTVSFFDGVTQLGKPVPIVAESVGTIAASYATAALSVGTHPITAVFSGNSQIVGSASTVLKQTVTPYDGDFTIQAAPADASCYTGEAASFQVAVSPIHGFQQPVSLSCQGLPAATTCSFSPSALTEGRGTSKLVIQSSAPHQTASSARQSPWNPGRPALAFAVLGLLWFPAKYRRSLRGRFLATLVLSGALLSAFLAVSACGGATSITGGTPPGVYKISVTAQTTGSGPYLNHASPVTLTVKSLF